MADELARYSRQTALPEIGLAGQHKLTNASMLIVGMGGLGLPAATYLAGAGVGRLTLVDHDTVALHNLHRQVLYRESDVGLAKVEVAARQLRQLNSAISIVPLRERLSSATVAELVAGHDIVLDAADNFTTTYLLSDSCFHQGRYLVSASILGNRGYLGVFCNQAPSYRALFPVTPTDTANCNLAGVLGSAVGALALMQAQEALKLVVAPQQALIGKLLTVDLWHNRFSQLDFSTAPEPDTAVRIDVLTRQELSTDDLLVDVRSCEEVAANPIEGAFHLPGNSGNYDFATLPTGAGRSVFFCISGARARDAAEQYQQRYDNRPCAVLLMS